MEGRPLRQSRLPDERAKLQSHDRDRGARDYRGGGEDREPGQARSRPRAHAGRLRGLRRAREKSGEADRAAHGASARGGSPRGSLGLSNTTPLRPARLRPGGSQEAIEARSRAEAAPAAGGGHLVRGRALVFWDPQVPGKKRDAIDTDQITPAADCVSESLATLDERW